MNRRQFAGLMAAASIGGPLVASAAARLHTSFAALRSRPLSIGMLMFDRMDQIDFTGPFSVLSRLPDASLEIIGLEAGPVRDHKGLVLVPEVTLAEARTPDVLVVPGGPGQQDLMHHRPLLDRIAAQVEAGRVVFSVCTGALLRGDEAAQRIQLDIQYAPHPPFSAGDPRTAPGGVLDAVKAGYQSLTEARRRTAREFAARSAA